MNENYSLETMISELDRIKNYGKIFISDKLEKILL